MPTLHNIASRLGYPTASSVQTLLAPLIKNKWVGKDAAKHGTLDVNLSYLKSYVQICQAELDNLKELTW